MNARLRASIGERCVCSVAKMEAAESASHHVPRRVFKQRVCCYPHLPKRSIAASSLSAASVSTIDCRFRLLCRYNARRARSPEAIQEIGGKRLESGTEAKILDHNVATGYWRWYPPPTHRAEGFRTKANPPTTTK